MGARYDLTQPTMFNPVPVQAGPPAVEVPAVAEPLPSALTPSLPPARSSWRDRAWMSWRAFVEFMVFVLACTIALIGCAVVGAVMVLAASFWGWVPAMLVAPMAVGVAVVLLRRSTRRA